VSLSFTGIAIEKSRAEAKWKDFAAIPFGTKPWYGIQLIQD
jgi:hypothetical protein